MPIVWSAVGLIDSILHARTNHIDVFDACHHKLLEIPPFRNDLGRALRTTGDHPPIAGRCRSA